MPLEFEVCKEFTFHAAHVLPDHSGKCSQPHGHTYRLLIWARGPLYTGPSTSDRGMVVDFGDLKQAYKTHLEPHLDHRDLNDSVPVSVPTAEMVAQWILETLRKLNSVMFYRVRLYETPTSYAEVTFRE